MRRVNSPGRVRAVSHEMRSSSAVSMFGGEACFKAHVLETVNRHTTGPRQFMDANITLTILAWPRKRQCYLIINISIMMCFDFLEHRNIFSDPFEVHNLVGQF